MAPIAMLVTVPPELLVALHGKFEPSALRGLLSGLPYGGGVAMIIWPWAVEAKRARAEKERMDMIEDIVVSNRGGTSFRTSIVELDLIGLIWRCDGLCV